MAFSKKTKMTAAEPSILKLNSLEEIITIVGCHYVLKSHFLGVSKTQIFSDLKIEIENFDLDEVSMCAAEILGLRDKSKLN